MAAPGIRTYEHDAGRVLVYTIEGEVSRNQVSAALESGLDELRPATRVVIADLSRTEGLSGSVIGLLVHYARELEAKGLLLHVVMPPSPVMARLVDLALGPNAPSFGSLAECLTHVRRAGLTAPE